MSSKNVNRNYKSSWSDNGVIQRLLSAAVAEKTNIVRHEGHVILFIRGNTDRPS